MFRVQYWGKMKWPYQGIGALTCISIIAQGTAHPLSHLSMVGYVLQRKLVLLETHRPIGPRKIGDGSMGGRNPEVPKLSLHHRKKLTGSEKLPRPELQSQTVIVMPKWKKWALWGRRLH